MSKPDVFIQYHQLLLLTASDESRVRVFDEWQMFFRLYSEFFDENDENMLAYYLGLQDAKTVYARCKNCDELWNIRAVSDESQWVCESCGNTWYCNDIWYGNSNVLDKILNPDFTKSCNSGKTDMSVAKPYHVSDNFERYLNIRAQGWSFTLSDEDRYAIVDWIHSLDHDPTLTEYRSALREMDLEKHWQRLPQFMSLAYPERAGEWLVLIPSSCLIKIRKAHRQLAHEFYRGASVKLGIRCFPHRGLTLAYLLYKWPDMHQYIRYANMPRLRATAEKARDRLWFMEYQLLTRPNSQPLERSPSFPIHLFYGGSRLLDDMPSLELIQREWHANELVLA